MSIQIPQAIQDALDKALQARADVDAAMTAQIATGQAETAASQANGAAQADLLAKTNALDQARKTLEALEDAYLTPGGTIPPAPGVSPVAPLPGNI